MSYTSLRIHPAIGIARVGNSEEYYLGPETMAGMDIPGQILTGGLSIKPGTESTTIVSTDVRDSSGRLKRQAARFRIFQYVFSDKAGAETYPTGQGEEVKIGGMVDGKKVKDIIWTVHLANKKANSWQGGDGVDPFADGALPPLRNPDFGKVASDPIRLKKLVIDAGPRAINSASCSTVHFDKVTQASAGNLSDGSIVFLPKYPVSFPASDCANQQLHSRVITTLGAITSESSGRLIVMGGYGLACGFDKDGHFSPKVKLNGDVNNNYWLDDTADGPVTAFLLFEDESTKAVDGNAWVISADPSYAPQTTNVVTLWDDLYCTWLEKLKLQPSIYNNHYQTNYKVDFAKEVYPIFRAASLQKWNTSLPARAIGKHDEIGKITADWDEFKIMNFIRDPNKKDGEQIGSPLMPLSLGDANKSFLSPTKAQYFFLKQWSEGHYLKNAASTKVAYNALGAGEALDKIILFNCLGGRFSPGIEMSFIVRDINLYQQDWAKHHMGGPFRINMRHLDYSKVKEGSPFLGVGYIPLRNDQVEPGDLCKFMALPWHTDYNSCATHIPSPNPDGEVTMHGLKDDWKKGMPAFNTLLYSSWPAQRPVAVYTYEDVVANNGELARPRFSVRGEGTAITQTIIEPADTSKPSSPDNWKFSLGAAQVGRYQDREEFLLNWHKIGVVMQGPAIVSEQGAPKISNDFYLEVASEFATDKSNLVEPWRNTVIDKLYPPETEKIKS